MKELLLDKQSPLLSLQGPRLLLKREAILERKKFAIHLSCVYRILQSAMEKVFGYNLSRDSGSQYEQHQGVIQPKSAPMPSQVLRSSASNNTYSQIGVGVYQGESVAIRKWVFGNPSPVWLVYGLRKENLSLLQDDTPQRLRYLACLLDEYHKQPDFWKSYLQKKPELAQGICCLLPEQRQYRLYPSTRKLMKLAEQRAGKVPKIVRTDKLRSYVSGIEEAFGADTKHVQSGPFKFQDSGESTAEIERFHKTLEQRTKVFEKFKDIASIKLLTDGWLINYNFFKQNEGCGNIPPAQACSKTVPFKDWNDVVRPEHVPEVDYKVRLSRRKSVNKGVVIDSTLTPIKHSGESA